jgi:hypothetical protein
VALPVFLWQQYNVSFFTVYSSALGSRDGNRVLRINIEVKNAWSLASTPPQ